MAELLGGLAFIGNYMNSRQSKQQLDKQKHKLSTERTNGNNIFDNSFTNNVYKETKRLAKERYEKSKNPVKTGVIPRNFNNSKGKNKKRIEGFSSGSDSDFSDDGSMCSGQQSQYSSNSVDGSDPSHFINKGSKMLDNRIHERKFVTKVGDNNNFLSQFDSLTFNNPNEPSSSNAVTEMSGLNAGVARMENERNLALNGGYSNFEDNSDMTYGVVDKEHFTHNNMKPFFKSRDTNPFREQQLHEMSQRKMELFVGSDQRDGYQHKTEHKPLFNPVTNMTNTFGMPVMTDYLESRYMPSRERRNELPFQPIKVTPGLGLGYNEQAKFGHHDPYRPPLRTIDDIRTIGKQQKSYTVPVVPGQKGSKGGIIGNVVKRKAVTFRETGPNDMVKTFGGAITAPAIHGEFNPNTMATKNRGLLRRVQYGAATHTVPKVTPHELHGKSKESSRQSFTHAEPRNIHLVEGMQARPDHEHFVPKLTQRSQETNYLGPLGNSEHTKVTAFNENDVPDQTLRDIHQNADRYGNTRGAFTKGQSIDYTDIPDQTLRDIHQKTDRYGNTKGPYTKGQSIDYSDIPDPTLRDIHQKTDRHGNIKGPYTKGQSVDYTDVPDPTLRDIHQKTDRHGNIKGPYTKGQSVDYTDVPDSTLRDIHQKTDRHGNIKGPYSKGQSVDYTDVPDPTLRDIHQKTDRHGNIKGPYTKGQSVDYTDVPDPTLRDIHQKTDRHGNIKGSYTKGQSVDYTDVPDPTLRDIHQKTDRHGNIKGSYTKGQSVDYTDVPDPTLRDIHQKTDRHGNIKGSYSKGQAVDYTDVPDPTLRDIHQKTDRHGNLKGPYSKGQAVDYTDVPDPTLRDMHQKVDRYGNTKGPYSKGQAIDYSDVPDMTMRDVHSKTDRAGNIRSMYTKGQAIDYADVPDMTMRDVHSKTDRAGNIRSSYTKGQAIDYTDVPDITMREIHSKTDRAGNVRSAYTKGQAIDYTDVPDIGMREIHGKTDRAGNIGAYVSKGHAIDYTDVPDVTMREIHNYSDVAPARGMDKQRPRDDVNNGLVNTSREELSKGRTPTLIGVNKGHTLDFTEFSYGGNRDTKNDRTPAPGLLIQSTDYLPFKGTHIQQVKWYSDDGKEDRKLLEDTLEHNKYINNTQHKARILKTPVKSKVQTRLIPQGKIIYY
jgi:hypothetical protein